MNVKEAKDVIRRIEKWSKSHKMTLNKKKSAVMFVNTKNSLLSEWEERV